MFTVKYIDGDGVEHISECSYVVMDRTPEGATRVMTFSEIPTVHCDNNSGVYVNNGAASSNGPALGPSVYVMNRFGATVATYRL